MQAKKYRSEPEHLMAIHLEEMGIEFEHDYRFHVKRKFMIDFAIIEPKIAIEVEGITREGGRHQKIIGFMNDCEKYNLLVSGGWKLLRIPHIWITNKRYYQKFDEFKKQIRHLSGELFIL